MISVQCACGKSFMTRPANAGKKTKCPTCGTLLTIPGGESAGTDEIDKLLGAWPPRQAPSPVTLPPPPRTSATSLDQAASSRTFSVDAQVAPSVNGRAGRRSHTSTLETDVSVVAGLFDLNFRQFITPAIIRSLYLSHLALVAICVAVLMLFNYMSLVGSASNEFGTPWLHYTMVVFTDLLAFLFLFMWTLVVRLGLEAVMVLFRGEEHLRALVESGSDLK